MKHILLLLAFAATSAHAQTSLWSKHTEPLVEGIGGAYVITSPGQLAYLAEMLNTPAQYEVYARRTYQLGADIDLAAHRWDVPVGVSNLAPFRGTFNGNNRRITFQHHYFFVDFFC